MGADVNAENSEGKTVLHEAILKGSVPVIEYLLKNGANVHLKTRQDSHKHTYFLIEVLILLLFLIKIKCLFDYHLAFGIVVPVFCSHLELNW